MGSVVRDSWLSESRAVRNGCGQIETGAPVPRFTQTYLAGAGHGSRSVFSQGGAGHCTPPSVKPWEVLLGLSTAKFMPAALRVRASAKLLVLVGQPIRDVQQCWSLVIGFDCVGGMWTAALSLDARVVPLTHLRSCLGSKGLI